MANRPDPFKQPTKPGQWPRLEQLKAKPHEMLAGFVHGCAENLAERTTAVTTLVVVLWQLAGRKMSHRLPSLVQVNTNGDATDPVDLFASHLLATASGSDSPRIYNEGYFMGGTPEQAPATMANAIRAKRKLGAVTPANASIHAGHEHRFFDAQRTGFGCGQTRSYAGAFHDAFGLLTGRKGELILRLDGRDDRDAFRRDVLEEPDRVRTPAGYGPGLKLVPKTTAVSGSISIDMWDAELARGMVDLGLLMLMLPGLAKDAPATDNLPVLELLASILPKSFDAPVVEPANFIPEPWFIAYRDELRRRLRHLPADYEYSIHKLAREVAPVCQRIAAWVGRGASPLEVEALWLELCMHTLCGLVLSVAGLAWHVLGFDPGCPRAKALRVLQCLEKGPVSKADLRRSNHLDKEMRDTLVGKFAAERLVRVEGKTVAATDFREFVTGLYSWERLPQPVDLRSVVAGKGESAA